MLVMVLLDTYDSQHQSVRKHVTCILAGEHPVNSMSYYDYTLWAHPDPRSDLTDKKTGEKLAVKVISKRKLTTPEEIDDVRREVQIMHHLAGHENVVHLKVSRG